MKKINLIRFTAGEDYVKVKKSRKCKIRPLIDKVIKVISDRVNRYFRIICGNFCNIVHVARLNTVPDTL